LSCIKCKKDLPEGAAFCPWCGKKQAFSPRRKSRRPNKTGTVYKKSGNRARPWVASRSGVTVGYFETKKEALEALERVSGKRLTDRYNMTFSQVYDGWKKEHFEEVGDTTIAQYKRAYDVAAPLHDRLFRELRTPDFQAVLDAQKDLAKSTVEKFKQLFTSMSDWAIREEIIETNFASYAKAKGADSKPHQPFTAEEIEKIKAEGSETARIVLMLLATGMRISELFDLPLADYHKDYVIGGEKSEEGRERIIPIREEGREHFAYFAAKAKVMLLDGYTGNKNAPNFRKRNYYSLLDRLGIDRNKTPHSTRTTYATRAVDEGLSPAVAQKVLGHADFDTTQKYYNKPDAESLVSAVTAAAQKEKPKDTKGRHKRQRQ